MAEITQYLKCDVEQNVAGPSEKTSAKWTAEALRRIADKIERDEYQDGFHDIADKFGKKLGTVYFDFSEGEHFDENR